MKNITFLFILTGIILASISCNSNQTGISEEDVVRESKKLNEWFDQVWNENVDRDPVWQAYLGIKDKYNIWGDYDDAKEEREFKRMERNLQYLRENFDFEKLDHETQTSYRLWIEYAENRQKNHEFRLYNYPINQMFGVHAHLPSFLINIHHVENKENAESYVKRLFAIDTLMDRVISNLQTREEKGIIPPKFIFPSVIDACQNIISGAPFAGSSALSPLLEDLNKKVEALEISEDEKAVILDNAERALINSVEPAYNKLMEYWQQLSIKSNDDAGVWKLPNGNQFYERRLESITRTDMTPDQIFEIGMSEVKRIQSEMEKIMKKIGFEGERDEFFEHMEKSKKFYEDNTPEGRENYLNKTNEIINSMSAKLDEMFITKPVAKLKVKAVEPFREKTVGKAFYERPAPDSSRPGIYYVNLYDMTQMPTYQMEALAYHEAIPGHHMQLSIMQEVKGLPKFRTLGGNYTSYTEGWGLYSEYFPKEFGFYEDPYSDFGRLTMELWRACRLVVDVGIHSRQWTREEGIEFYTSNTPNPYSDCVKMVERHIVMPGQATAYKVGQIKILELRSRSMKELGKNFDIREFHEKVLVEGALPLSILEENIEAWLASKKAI